MLGYKAAGHPGHPQFEEILRVVLGEVLTMVEGVKQWMEMIRTFILVASSARKRRATGSRHEETTTSVPPVPLHITMEGPPPSRSVAARAPVQPTTEWLTRMFKDLGMGQRSGQASEPARQPQSVDATTLLAWTQALTSQSLHQVVEGLTSVSQPDYIAWKTHYQENYLGMWGDTLRVLVERCL